VEITFYAFLPLYAFALRGLPGKTASRRWAGEAAGLALISSPRSHASLARRGSVDEDAVGAVQGLLDLPSFFDQFPLGMGLAVLRPIDRFSVLGWAIALICFWAVSTQSGLDEPTTRRSTSPAITSMRSWASACCCRPCSATSGAVLCAAFWPTQRSATSGSSPTASTCARLRVHGAERVGGPDQGRRAPARVPRVARVRFGGHRRGCLGQLQDRGAPAIEAQAPGAHLAPGAR
jgi:hypothetical protein